MAINIKKHFYERFVERVIGITDKVDIMRYTNEHRDKLTSDINKMFEHAVFVYRGQIGNNMTMNFYMRDHMIMIADSQNTALITIYKCDYGFPEATNRKIAKDMFERSQELLEELNKAGEDIKEYVEQRELEASNIATQIRALDEQIKILRQQKEAVEADISARKGSVSYLHKELDKCATLLCNSIEYRKEQATLDKV